MTGYDDDLISGETVLRAVINNGNLTPQHHPRRYPRRLQLLDHVHLADAIALTHAVYIGPDSEWACPITFSDRGAQYPSLNDPAIARIIRQDFAVLARRGELHFPNWRHLGGTRGPITFTYALTETGIAVLAGRDLACLCRLDEACHGDVLLRLANPANPCPECTAGKHRNCDGTTLDDTTDTWILCNCHDTTHPTRTATALAAARQEAANRP
ncbi:hypothetical protein CH252_19035 [Rhodococcus sp. 06-1477-1B]|nr:hypothetical protein CH252_19035 [Rhodococcus sp. 06-1477-1B]